MDWQTFFYTTAIPHGRRERMEMAILKRFRCGVWRTLDGKMIPICLMRLDHMENAWRYGVRNANAAYQSRDWRGHDKATEKLHDLASEYRRRGIAYDIETLRLITAHDEELNPEDYNGAYDDRAEMYYGE